jgi:hypothetical protein
LILYPLNLHLKWFMPGETSPLASETWMRTVFLRFHGACTTIPAENSYDRPMDSGRITLAQTAVSEGTILPYTDTDCDRLRNFLAEGKPAAPGEESRLGIAMARVLAHELYHVLLQTPEHSKRGIARAIYTPAALLGQSLRFESGELEKIRAKYSLAQ